LKIHQDRNLGVQDFRVLFGGEDLTIELLKEMLEKYFCHLVTKEELGIWAENVYHNFVKGDYIIINNLKIYHFVRILSRFHIVPDDIKDEYPCSEEEVKSIFAVVNGDISKTLTFKIKLPKVIYENFCKRHNIDATHMSKFDEIKTCIVDCSNRQEFLDEKTNELMIFFTENYKEIVTLVDLLEAHFVGILRENIACSDEVFGCKQNVGIYATRNEKGKKESISSLLKILNCITGESQFRICVTYYKGTPNLSLLI